MEKISDVRLSEILNWVTYRTTITEHKDGIWCDTLSALTELRERRLETQDMINISGEAIGTDLSLRSSACVKVLADHVEYLRNELRERRAADKKAYKHFCHMCANPVQLCKCTDRT
jgi:hypothetical protein